MPGPIDGLKFAHTAIERELTDLDRLVTKATSPADAAALADRFAFLERFCEGHTKGEEIGLFPTLDEKVPKLSQTYLFDHGDERAAFARIHADLARCTTDDADALPRLRSEVSKLADHVIRHIRKENELVIPLVHELFSVPEQGAIVQKVVSAFPPADMADLPTFLLRWPQPLRPQLPLPRRSPLPPSLQPRLPSPPSRPRPRPARLRQPRRPVPVRQLRLRPPWRPW